MGDCFHIGLRSNLELDFNSGRLVKKTRKLAAGFLHRRSPERASFSAYRDSQLGCVACGRGKIPVSLRAKAFISFDNRQRKLATAVGLTVAP